MRKALFMCSCVRRSNSEKSTIPNSQAYSTSRSLAIIKKFWLVVALIRANIKAKVNVVEAMMK